MSELADIVDIDLMEQMVTEGYVHRKTSPCGRLLIHNYSQAAQYGNVWNDATLLSRGLITTAEGAIAARPFRKFFNLSQLETLPTGEPTFHEKLDGSLGITYVIDGRAHIATRGSFVSDQAMWATAWLQEQPELERWAHDRVALEGVTPLFEIIYPSNRIVVEYGDRSELVLLAVICMTTGHDVECGDWPGTHAKRERLVLADVLEMDDPNREGYVLRWPGGERAKCKFPNYVRLHKLLTGVNARTIWDLLANGQPLDELLDLVPDEFYDWVYLTVGQLTTEFDVIAKQAADVLDRVDMLAERREQAEFIIANSSCPGVVFSMLDGKAWQPAVWKLIRPAALPFAVDVDA